MKTTRMTVMLGSLLTIIGGSSLAGELLVDSDFTASPDSAGLRANSAGQDWYDSRQDNPGLLTLDLVTVGGNASAKAKLSESSTGNAYLTQEFSSPQTQTFSVQWDIYVNSILDLSDDPDRGGWMLIGDDTGTTASRIGPNAEDSERFVYMGFSKDGGGTTGTMDLVARDRDDTWSTFTTVASGLNLRQWYTIKVSLDLGADTYDVYVDGEYKATLTSRNAKSSMTYISFAQWNDGAGTFYVDNVTTAPLVTVPNVVGMAEADAQSAISSAGLVVGTISQANSDTVPEGDVISQDPAAGTRVAQGTAVNLVVSTGPAGGPSEEPYEEAWVGRYNGPGDANDQARALALDGLGNVYVTGYSAGSGTGDDFATIKYDAYGSQLWVARYNGPGNDHDWPNALAVDSSGNVYVTGESFGVGTRSDYATIKYDSNGNQLWVARWVAPGGGDDMPMALAVDNSGNVYVTGWGTGMGNFDYLTVKYSPNGQELWVARYNGPGNTSDRANALALDSSGNVYVTGWSENANKDNDYATVKYSSNGQQLWAARYNGPVNQSDIAEAVVVDSSGNVYVTGGSQGSGTSHDYATIKYSSNGQQLWVARYNGPGNGYDFGSALAIDSSSNVYVTGYSMGSGTKYDYATVKYDANGNRSWVARYNGPANGHDYAWALALEDSRNVYVTGECYGGGTHSSHATIKYDSNGNELCVTTREGGFSFYFVVGGVSLQRNNLAIDASGNVYVANDLWGDGTQADYVTIKYTQSGSGPGPGPEPTGEPSITLNPATGPAGTTITITGSGFTAGDVGCVELDSNHSGFWDWGEPYRCQVAVDADGRFSTTLTVPSSATPGDCTVWATFTGIEATAVFKVMP